MGRLRDKIKDAVQSVVEIAEGTVQAVVDVAEFGVDLVETGVAIAADPTNAGEVFQENKEELKEGLIATVGLVDDLQSIVTGVSISDVAVSVLDAVGLENTGAAQLLQDVSEAGLPFDATLLNPSGLVKKAAKEGAELAVKKASASFVDRTAEIVGTMGDYADIANTVQAGEIPEMEWEEEDENPEEEDKKKKKKKGGGSTSRDQEEPFQQTTQYGGGYDDNNQGGSYTQKEETMDYDDEYFGVDKYEQEQDRARKELDDPVYDDRGQKRTDEERDENYFSGEDDLEHKKSKGENDKDTKKKKKDKNMVNVTQTLSGVVDAATGGGSGDANMTDAEKRCPSSDKCSCRPKYSCEEKCAYGREMGEKCQGCTRYSCRRTYRRRYYPRRSYGGFRSYGGGYSGGSGYAKKGGSTYKKKSTSSYKKKTTGGKKKKY